MTFGRFSRIIVRSEARTERTVLDRLNGVPVRCDFAAGKLKGERGSGGGGRFYLGGGRGGRFV